MKENLMCEYNCFQYYQQGKVYVYILGKRRGPYQRYILILSPSISTSFSNMSNPARNQRQCHNTSHIRWYWTPTQQSKSLDPNRTGHRWTNGHHLALRNQGTMAGALTEIGTNWNGDMDRVTCHTRASLCHVNVMQRVSVVQGHGPGSVSEVVAGFILCCPRLWENWPNLNELYTHT